MKLMVEDDAGNSGDVLLDQEQDEEAIEEKPPQDIVDKKMFKLYRDISEVAQGGDTANVAYHFSFSIDSSLSQ